MYSAFYFFSGFVDLFLAVMLWLIFDSEKKPMFFVDGVRVYTVEDVIKLRDSSINEDCCDREQEDVRSTTEFYASSLGIS
jgi:hypothetical protein